MTNLLDRFKKSSVGSVNKDVTYTDNITPSGDFSRFEGINAILYSWKNILRTGLRSADHDPTYGSKLKEYIFDPADSSTREKIVDEVKSRLMRFDNRAIISKVNVSFRSNMKGFILEIDVLYNGETKNLKVNIDESLIK